MVLGMPSPVSPRPLLVKKADCSEYAKFYATLPQCQMVIIGAGWVSHHFSRGTDDRTSPIGT